MLRPAVPDAPYAAVPGGRILFMQPPSSYGSTPPGLLNFRPVDAAQARGFLSVLAREAVACPQEAVMLFADAFVLDGQQVLSAEGVGVAESFADLLLDAALVARQQAQLTAIASGGFAWLEAAGPPVVAIFKAGCGNFGHVLAEMLPRLVHVAALGFSEVRLLLPAAAEGFRGMIGFAAAALGLRVDFVPCPAGSILRVPALHWVAPVSRHNDRKSPTLLRLFAHLREAAGPGAGPDRLYVARPPGVGRAITNAAAVEALAADAGFTVVEPSRLDFAAQIRLFAGARSVLGPMGAALTLTGAIAPGGRVAMIDPSTCDFFYWDLACLTGLGFDWGFVAPVLPFREAMLREGFDAPPALVRSLLAGFTAM